MRRRTLKKKLTRHYREEWKKWRRLNLDSHTRWAKEVQAKLVEQVKGRIYDAMEATLYIGGVEYKGADFSLEARTRRIAKAAPGRVTSTSEDLANGVFTMTIEVELQMPYIEFIVIDDVIEPDKKC